MVCYMNYYMGQGYEQPHRACYRDRSSSWSGREARPETRRNSGHPVYPTIKHVAPQRPQSPCLSTAMQHSRGH